MEFIRLTGIAHPLFQESWELYEHAFPLEERRPMHWQLDILPHASYYYEIIVQQESLVGMLLWWSFEEIRYVEHFATVPGLRGKGYGKRILENFLARDTQPVLLEVEPPRTETQLRRIRFYEASGFALNYHFYQQPPYHPGQAPLTLLLMSHPTAISAQTTAHFVNKRHPLIYRLP